MRNFEISSLFRPGLTGFGGISIWDLVWCEKTILPSKVKLFICYLLCLWASSAHTGMVITDRSPIGLAIRKLHAKQRNTDDLVSSHFLKLYFGLSHILMLSYGFILYCHTVYTRCLWSRQQKTAYLMALLNDAFTVPLLIFGKFTPFIIYTYVLHSFKIWGLIYKAEGCTSSCRIANYCCWLAY